MNQLWPAPVVVTVLTGVGACGEHAPTAPDAAVASDGHPDAAPLPPDAFDHGTTVFTQSMLGTPMFDVTDWVIWTDWQDPGRDVPALHAVWPNHVFDSTHVLLAPRVVHDGPYELELTSSIPSTLRKGNRFLQADWTYPRGLYFSATVVPAAGAPTGASFDSDAGPVIPNSLFPLKIDGELIKDGQIIDPHFDSMYPAASTVTGSEHDGYSHIPLNFGENTSYIPGYPSQYIFRVHVTDSNGNGWRTDVPFTIVP